MLTLLRNLQQGGTNTLWCLLRYAIFRCNGPRILAHQHARIRGVRNIETDGLLRVGVDALEFQHPADRTLLDVQGKLVAYGANVIGRGCRVHIGVNGRLTMERAYLNGFSRYIVHHQMSIGPGTIISWGCQFLDTDLHQLEYTGRIEHPKCIEIGSHVWIGSQVTVLRGVHLADGVVVAAGSVVTKSFRTPNVLIGGNPAKLIRSDVRWR